MRHSTPKTSSYKKTRRAAYLSATLAILFSMIAGVFVFEASSGKNTGAFGAAGQVAAVIPGFAGVLLAAFALSAYMREEDDIVKLAEAAWLGRNRFLFCSQYLYYGVASDMGQSGDEVTRLTDVKECLVSLLPEFNSCLLNTELARAMAQNEIESSSGDGGKASFAVRGFVELIDFFVSSEDSTLVARRDREEQAGNFTRKQILDIKVLELIRVWADLAEHIEKLDSVEKFEMLLRQNYQHSLKANLHQLLKQHTSS